jgi:hypothetical protein
LARETFTMELILTQPSHLALFKRSRNNFFLRRARRVRRIFFSSSNRNSVFQSIAENIESTGRTCDMQEGNCVRIIVPSFPTLPIV